ncbi:UbiA-like protein EboC [Leptospira jelokensis]|uniref:Polyprenyltransferase n=1 Tax=Leptospira jelokensis TaxID=2484931 RepID=A0A4Z1ABK6_9LEPT|nr:UbiA-like protein EboC [Leptospira jelokensis]TGL75644.1 polyprenyltransferase [Leptospira jelokensis]
MLIRPTLQLLRPANLVTAVADILAGMCIVSFHWNGFSYLYLIGASVSLYAGGVVFNDYFDRKIDAKERPERPIPSGNVSKEFAFLLGTTLLMIGVAFAFLYSCTSFFVSLLICFFVLLYNYYAKHHIVFGPLVMGFCRGLNLVFGMTSVSEIPELSFYLSILPIVYIAAITLVSQNEVLGGGKSKLRIASFLFGGVFFVQIFLSFLNGNLLTTLPFVLFHISLLFPPLLKSMQEPSPEQIRKTVKMGVLTLIVLNVSFAASFGNLVVAILILALLPISLGIAKGFAVT